MNTFQFFVWSMLCVCVFITPFSILRMSPPWSKNPKVVISKTLAEQVPPLPTLIVTRRSPVVTAAVDWNIQRAVQEKDRWRVEFWTAENLKLLEKRTYFTSKRVYDPG